MICVAEGDAGDAVLAGEGDGLIHGGLGVEIAGAEAAVPALDGAEAGGADGLGCGIHGAVADGRDEAGKAVDAVGVDAVAGGFREEAGAGLGASGGEA